MKYRKVLVSTMLYLYLQVPVITPVRFLGAGIVNEGDAFNIGGTSETPRKPFVLLFLRFQGNCCFPIWQHPDQISFVEYGVSSNGGSVIKWLGDLLFSAFPEMERSEKVATHATGILPLMSNPIFSAVYSRGNVRHSGMQNAKGSWHGLRSEHSPADICHSVLEGMAMNLRAIRESLSTMSARAFHSSDWRYCANVPLESD